MTVISASKMKKRATTILSGKSFMANQVALSLFAVLAHLSIKSQLSHAYVITMDAGIENECFHERVPVGTKLGYSFEVIEGGFYDIDITLKDPNNVILHQEDRTSNGKFTIEASIEGDYQLCFDNKRTSFAPKVIMFDIDQSSPSSRAAKPIDGSQNPSDDKEDSEVAKISGMVDSLTRAAVSARHDVRYLHARDRVHRQLSEKTNQTIMYWSGLEFVLLMVVSVGQVVYVKRFFEIRRQA